ncbi:hypothetical protein BDW22DRAFT_1218967 [Trametopsis cervina]|nr:hypothetical protein BDW22DRAFT_1218967 [Trametopsis cervina]
MPSAERLLPSSGRLAPWVMCTHGLTRPEPSPATTSEGCVGPVATHTHCTGRPTWSGSHAPPPPSAPTHPPIQSHPIHPIHHSPIHAISAPCNRSLQLPNREPRPQRGYLADVAEKSKSHWSSDHTTHNTYSTTSPGLRGALT